MFPPFTRVRPTPASVGAGVPLEHSRCLPWAVRLVQTTGSGFAHIGITAGRVRHKEEQNHEKPIEGYGTG